MIINKQQILKAILDNTEFLSSIQLLDNFKESLKDKDDLEKLSLINDVLSTQKYDNVVLTNKFNYLLNDLFNFIEIFNNHQLIFSLQNDKLESKVYQDIISNKELIIFIVNNGKLKQYEHLLYAKDINSLTILINCFPDIIINCDGMGIYNYLIFLIFSYHYGGYTQYFKLQFNKKLLIEKLTADVSLTHLKLLYTIEFTWNKQIKNIIKNILDAKQLINNISSQYIEGKN